MLVRALPRARHVVRLWSPVRTYATNTGKILDDFAQQTASDGTSMDDKRRAKFEQYTRKLTAKAHERGLGSVEELARRQKEEDDARSAAEREERARKHAEPTTRAADDGPALIVEKDAALQERLRVRRQAEETRKLESHHPDTANSPVTPLSSFLNVEKILTQSPETIGELWTAYHTMRNKLSAVIPAATYQRMLETGRKFPQFVLPLPRTEANGEGQKEDAFEMYFLQWSSLPQLPHVSKNTPEPSAVLFTSLAEYKLRQEYAQPALILTHYTDLIESKGIVLLRGDITEHDKQGESTEPVLKQHDAQLLAMCMQRFFHTEWALEGLDNDQQAEERRKLLRTFHEDPEAFSVDRLLGAAFVL